MTFFVSYISTFIFTDTYLVKQILKDKELDIIGSCFLHILQQRLIQLLPYTQTNIHTHPLAQLIPLLPGHQKETDTARWLISVSQDQWHAAYEARYCHYKQILEMYTCGRSRSVPMVMLQRVLLCSIGHPLLQKRRAAA